MRLPVPRLALLACATLAVLPAAADAAAPKKVTYPLIKKVSPLKLRIGDTLTINGRGFRSGKGKNTVVFKRSGKPAVFAKSTKSTTTRLTVVVPDKLTPFLGKKNKAAVATRFQLRVLARRFAKRFTSRKLSPVISPKAGDGGGGGAGPAPDPNQLCQAGAAANPGADADADGLANGTERQIGTDPCNADSDHDGMVDGYEYESALDLNSRARPYPAKRPWPNPLDPTDGGYDFDGDGLTVSQEYRLWKAGGGAFPVTAYSDGTQNSGGVMPAAGSLDLDGDGNLTDDERDADFDGLSNIVEYQFRGINDWWLSKYTDERPYAIRAFSGVDPTVFDSDGDGRGDGEDDQDNDGADNFTEMQLGREGSGLRVQPFNPCLPNPHAPTCSRYVPFTGAWPPFDGSQAVGAAIPFKWPIDNRPVAGGWDGNGGPQGA